VALQRAMHVEHVEGDLERAIQLYRDIVAQHGDVRNAAAKALLRLGSCYEKLGSSGKTSWCWHDRGWRLCSGQLGRRKRRTSRHDRCGWIDRAGRSRSPLLRTVVTSYLWIGAPGRRNARWGSAILRSKTSRLEKAVS
jgi:hypothetical protein